MSKKQSGAPVSLRNFVVIGHFDGDGASCFTCRAADAREAERQWERYMRRLRREDEMGSVDYYMDAVLSSDTAIEVHE